MAVVENIANIHFLLKKEEFCLLNNLFKYQYLLQEGKKNCKLLGCKLQGSFLTQH